MKTLILILLTSSLTWAGETDFIKKFTDDELAKITASGLGPKHPSRLKLHAIKEEKDSLTAYKKIIEYLQGENKALVDQHKTSQEFWDEVTHRRIKIRCEDKNVSAELADRLSQLKAEGSITEIAVVPGGLEVVAISEAEYDVAKIVRSKLPPASMRVIALMFENRR